MNDTIQYDNYTVLIKYNKKLKHSYISIDRDKKIILKTPSSSRVFAENLVKEKSQWIQKQLLKIEKVHTLSEKKLFEEDFLESRLKFYSQEMGLAYTKLTLKKMKSRWGSCNSRREIVLNSELTKVSQNLIDYVVVHELAHIKHMNHSKTFHALVEHYLPNSKLFRKELKLVRLT